MRLNFWAFRKGQIMAISITQDVINRHLLPKLRDLLSQCTVKQKAFFDRMYPCGIDNMEAEKIIHAIWQCENTIKNNGERIE